jgi:hypothetical protein
MRRPSAVLAVVLIASLPAVDSRAADVSAGPDHYALAGHHFLVSHLVQDPFSVTSFGMNFAVGAGRALGPSLDFSTSPPTVVPGSRWYDYAGLVQQFDFTARILENLSIRAGLLAGLRQGAGNGSALVVGTSLRIAGVGGVKGSVQVAPGVRLSLSGDIGYGPHLNFLLLQGLRESLPSNDIDWSNVFKDRNSTTATLTGAAAWAIQPWLGLIGNAQYLHSKNEAVGASGQDGFAASGSLEFDALPLVDWLPVGANLAYRSTGSNGASGLASQQEFGGGVYYTGRPHLALGVEVEGRRGKLDTELKSKQTLGWVNFRYYW